MLLVKSTRGVPLQNSNQSGRNMLNNLQNDCSGALVCVFCVFFCTFACKVGFLLKQHNYRE